MKILTGQNILAWTQLREGLFAWRATGAEAFRSHHLALLAEAYEKGGQAKEGLTAVNEALVFVERTDERFYEAELHRLKGELLQKAESRRQSLKSKKKPKNVSRNPLTLPAARVQGLYSCARR